MEEDIKFSELCHFLPRQIEATTGAYNHTYTLYGGSAGPGKSYWLRWYPILQMMKWGEELGLTGIHGALFSKDYTTLKDRQVSKMEAEFPKWLGEVKNTQTDGLGFHLKEEYGGHVFLLRNLDDPSKYLSSEFAIIAQEEATENPEDVFHKLRGRLRWTGVPNPKWIGATNPGGIGHQFFKKIFIDRDFPEELKPIANEFIYVRALPTDNPYLAESYLKTLDSLPEKLRKAYRDGNWDVFEGQYFTEWDHTKHVCAPFAIPLSWPKFRSIDISGHSGITSCHWYAVNNDGRVFVYREYYQTDRDYDEHAKAIYEMSLDEDGIEEPYRYTVIDNSAFAKAGFSETPAEIYNRHGVNGLIPSAKDRVPGWTLVHQYLRWDEKLSPLLQIFSTCYNLIKEIPLAQHDEKNPEDILTKYDGASHNDALDDCRYFLRTLRETKAVKPLTPIERKLQQNMQNEQAMDFSYARK